jgi:hypothetical protein
MENVENVEQAKPFEVGDTVYDSIIHPGKEGKVIAVIADPGASYPVKVEFGYNDNHSYSPDGAFFANVIPTLSHVNYKVVKTTDRVIFENFFKL